nr:hypothetical protein [Streptomyces sp. CBMA123]
MAAYPPPPGPVNAALAEAQARQAATLAAALRYPTDLDAQLLHVLAPSGSGRLDWLAGNEPEDAPWRTWVEEVVVSWAACLLADPALAARARRASTAAGPHGLVGGLERLTSPGAFDAEAGALLRHPDLLEGVAFLHRDELVELLDSEGVTLA